MQPAHAPDTHVATPSMRRAGLFAFLGGPIAWFVHLALCYAIGEFGCVAGAPRWTWLGVHGLAWMVIAVSVVTFGISLVAGIVGYRMACGEEGMLGTPPGGMTGADYLTRAGAVLSLLLAAIIAVQSVPILFYLEGC